jgi:2-polyprenyl-3-methyl-5-hydroxy-6-metoxy-1,4-benzoquinol methylase
MSLKPSSSGKTVISRAWTRIFPVNFSGSLEKGAYVGFTKMVRDLLNPNSKGYWDTLYTSEIAAGKIRQDETVLRLLPLLTGRKNILDFGCGTGGNVRLLSNEVQDTGFHLVDHSERVIEFAAELLGHSDQNGNSFRYATDLDSLPAESQDAIISIEVLEHLADYTPILDRLWTMLRPEGVLIISVPVKGWRDRHREHVNKFTVKSMFEILSGYSEWVHLTPRTHSQRSGGLATAFFYIIKSQ